ncbi:NAD-binding protein [Haloplanus sp.]|uniref:NAD-binding protein n=1 Tax=Haloplanus sp. TaxID=1961696 RepID=UPI0026220748|nr:NAD-binding protein [Haloplanus sp.]
MTPSLPSHLLDRWVGWHAFGLRLTVALTAVVALLSVATGIANIGAQSVVGPLAEVIPRSIQRTAGFTGALTGFLMIASAYGLRRRLRVAWYSTVVLLPVTTIQGVLQSSPLSLPLVALSVVTLPKVLYTRRRFDRTAELTPAQLAAGVAIAGTQIYGTVGTYALREDFAGVSTLVDAFYYTLVTASTVGYGDVTPTSQVARLFGMSVVVIGTASFAVALGTLLGPVIQARFARALGRMSDTDLKRLDDHVLVLGYSDIVAAILDENPDPDSDVVVVTPDREVIQSLTDRDIGALAADPDDESSLHEAGVERARLAIVATGDDAADALTILTVRQLNPDVEIRAVATNRENVRKLEDAGATSVISPIVIAAKQLLDPSPGDGTGVDLLTEAPDDGDG